MTNTYASPAAAPSDADLVQRCLSSDSGAFAEIVARYQTLICSLTYNATGSLSRSEDLAQEVFLTAWKELRRLREPAKLRSWLCGIARQLSANTIRREGREPVCAAEEMEDRHHSPAPDPAEHAITREEEAILWRSLEQVPETYREPMILFYRDGQSTERVAEALELSEEAVRQRLSRGRKLLREEVALFVEGALRQSAPGQAFTLGVMAALVSLKSSATAAAIGTTAATGGAVAKSLGWAVILSGVIMPLLGCVTAWKGTRASLDFTQSKREREYIRKGIRVQIVVVLGVLGGMFWFVTPIKSWLALHPECAVTINVAASIGLVVFFRVGARLINRKRRRIREEEAWRLSPELKARHGRAWPTFEYKSPQTLLGLPLLHVRAGRGVLEKAQPAVGWIAIGDTAFGVIASVGVLAVGGISLGLSSVGLLAIGISAAGAVSCGGFLSIGLWGAMGLTSIGYLAHGHYAVAWHAATGHYAVAHQFAVGMYAMAPHANDAAAVDAISHAGFFRLAEVVARQPHWEQIAFIPVCLWPLRRLKRAQRRLKGEDALHSKA